AVRQRLIRGVEDTQGLSLQATGGAVERSARSIIALEFPRLVGDDKEDLIARLVDEVTGLGPIEGLVRDPNVSEIMVNAPDEIYYEREGVIYESEITFRNEAHVMRVIDRIVAALGRHVDEPSPLVDPRLDDGSRVNVIIP